VVALPELHRQIREAAARGLLCSQIVMDVGLRALGVSDGTVVRAMGGLVGAIGFKGVTCGALTSAGCLIYLAAHEKLGKKTYLLIEELAERFGHLAAEYPGLCCGDILDSEPDRPPTEVCPDFIAGAIGIALELLAGRGLAFEGGRPDDLHPPGRPLPSSRRQQ
jgi:hypothetical protein